MAAFLLASYPKSGNTWVRALLTNYLEAGRGPASINALVNYTLLDRQEFDDRFGLSSSAMTDEEVLRHRPRFNALLAAEAEGTVFCKVHEPCLRAPGRAPLFPPDSFAGVIHVVRNPLDIAVSFAHHRQQSIDAVLDHMNDPRAAVGRMQGSTGLPQPISTWSGHVSSWLDQRDIPALTVRYEDLLAAPEATFGAIVDFAIPPSDPDRIGQAVSRSQFERLREQEVKEGFHERQPTAPSFFRRGRSGDWRCKLTPSQVRRVVDAHGAAMVRLGYLGEAERFPRDS